MIRVLHIDGLRCVNGLQIKLGPVTALLGRAGSGKTSILQGLELLHRAAQSEYAAPFRTFGIPTIWPMVTRAGASTKYAIEVRALVEGHPDLIAPVGAPRAMAIAGYAIGANSEKFLFYEVKDGDRDWTTDPWPRSTDLPWDNAPSDAGTLTRQAMDRALGPCTVLRLDPRALAEPDPIEVGPTALLPDGHGLAGFLREVFEREDGDFRSIVDVVREIVPHVRGLRVRKVDIHDHPAFQLEVATPNGWIPAAQAGASVLRVVAVVTAALTTGHRGLLVIDDLDLHVQDAEHTISFLVELSEQRALQVVFGTGRFPMPMGGFLPTNEITKLSLDDAGFTQASPFEIIDPRQNQPSHEEHADVDEH